MDEPILELTNISKSFEGTHALREVNFDLFPGEVHALLGENGAGKSTLIKIITGVHQPDAGEIRLNGEPISFASPHDSQMHSIAAIYQEPSLFPDLDIAENIFVGRQPTLFGGRVAWSRMYGEAGGLLDVLGVQLDAETKARNLSMAQQQMVEIARALSSEASILIMDEPTSALTLAEVDDLFRIVRQLREAGTAVVFISHRLEELYTLADRVTVLRDGAYVATRNVAEVSTNELIQMMVGRTLADMYAKQVIEPGEVILEVEGLTREGSFEDVSFELRRGEILGMAGLVGAGRTDVGRAIFGILPATSGTIKIAGRPVEISHPRQAMQLGVVYVPEDRQHYGLVLPMSIAHNITLPILSQVANLGWMSSSQEGHIATQITELLDVRSTGVWQKARELSGGNQQKVVLAKWLTARPDILILDEPTRGIDVGTKAEVHRLMSELAAQGMAILMISSELPEVLGMSDRILVMREGHVTGRFNRAEVTQEQVMQAATSKQPVAID